MTYTNFELAINGDGIALVSWNVPDRSMNVITLQGIEELSAIVERLAADEVTAFVQRDGPGQRSFPRRDVFIHVLAVKIHACLQAQGVVTQANGEVDLVVGRPQGRTFRRIGRAAKHAGHPGAFGIGAAVGHAPGMAAGEAVDGVRPVVDREMIRLAFEREDAAAHSVGVGEQDRRTVAPRLARPVGEVIRRREDRPHLTGLTGLTGRRAPLPD